MAAYDVNRLYTLLLNTRLQTRDNPLYQVIHELIKSLASVNKETNSIISGGGSTVINQTNVIQQLLLEQGESGEDGFPGTPGSIIESSLFVPYFIALTEKFIVPEFKQALFAMNIDVEGILEVDGFLIEVDGIPESVASFNNHPIFFPEDSVDNDNVIPGPKGVDGVNGINGIDGKSGINGLDGEDGEDSLIPGPQGVAGLAGSQGLQGPQGIPGIPLFDEASLDIESFPVIAQGPQGNPGASGAMTLLKASSGTNSSAGATNLDTVAISGLTAKDTIIIYYNLDVTGFVASQMSLYNDTDAVTICNISRSTVAAGTAAGYIAIIRQQQSSPTKIFGHVVSFIQSDGLPSNTQCTVSTFATNWTDSWTLALRSGGSALGGTVEWSWAVYKVAGQ